MQEFLIDRVISEDRDGVEWTIFVLDQAKNGFNKIAFPFNNQERLQSVLMQCALGPRAFDFEFDVAKSKDAERKLGPGHCILRSLSFR